MERQKIFIELNKGLMGRIISTVDADIYVLTEHGKAKTFEDLEKWEPLIVVRNEKEFCHLAKKIIDGEI